MSKRTFSVLSMVVLATALAACDSVATSNKDLAVEALTAVFVDKDSAALNKYFDPSFVRHNPTAATDGIAELKGAIDAGYLGTVSYTLYRAFGEGDYTVVHGRYINYPTPGADSVTFDMFRFNGGKIVEHWDCMQQDPHTYVSGNTMVDGSTEVGPSASTQASNDVVVAPGKGFVPVVLIGGDFSKLNDFLGAYIQHDPLAGNGAQGLGAATSKPPLNTLKLTSVHKSIGDHDFVFVRSKGTMTWDAKKPNSPNNPTVYCDLFRVKDGKLEEHWDVIQLDPNSKSINDVKNNGAGHTMWD